MLWPLARGLADVDASWMRRYRVDSFRVDAACHVDRAFFRTWMPRILAAARAVAALLALSPIDALARREYLVAFNPGDEPLRAAVSTATPSASWTPLLGTETPAVSDASGRLTLDVPALSALVLRAGVDLPRRRPAAPALRIGEDPFTGLKQLTAAVPTADPVSVIFALRRAGDRRWRRLAADDSPPYRAFLDGKALLRGETAHTVAIVRASDESLILSPVKPFTLAGS